MRPWMTLACCLALVTARCQQEEVEETVLRALEADAAVNDDRESEDDGRLQLSDHLLRQRFPINQADPEEMGEALGLTDLQVRNFDRYRRLLGPFTDLLELQAVPGWDPETIRRVLPFLILSRDPFLMPVLRERLKKGEHQVLFRSGVQFEQAAGYRASAGAGPAFTGDRSKFLLKYDYRFRTLLQWGVTAEKDPGEPWFPGGVRKGFDHQSWHIAMREFRWLKALVVGDFQLNLGQGLVHWQGMAFRKTTDAMLVMRQGPALRGYSGTDENRFHRGIGVHLQRRNWEWLCFLSMDRLDGNLGRDTGSRDDPHLTSFQTSGSHRTSAEREDKDVFRQRVLGGSLRYGHGDLRISFNGINYAFNMPVRREPLPYNLHAIAGRRWSNYSVAYGLTLRNMHLFGEAAMDRRGNTAFLQGLLASLHARADISLLFRHISPAYRALQANAFTENTEPMNESGIYTGITIRPAPGWRIDAYADIFRFPWISYRVDRPASGAGHMVQVDWKPHKKLEMYLRWQRESKSYNQEVPDDNMSVIQQMPRTGLRWQLSFQPSSAIRVRSRLECTWQGDGPDREQGFLTLLDIICKPMGRAFSVTGRFSFFETGGYGSRVYAYEHDVLFYNAVSVFFDKGARYYLIFSRKFGSHWHFSCKLSRSVYPDEVSIGSGTTGLDGNSRTELRGQLIYRF